MSVRRFVLGALAFALCLGLTACDAHTVAIRFEPEVGDRYRFRSEIETEVERTVDGRTSGELDLAVLEATEQVTEVSGDEVTVDVTLERDGAVTRSYEVRFDRGDRLTAIDLVEGVPAEALGLDVGADLPPDVASPPPGPLEPGATWTIDEPLAVEGRPPGRVTGSGTIESLGVVEGNDVAVVVVELRVPVRSAIDTPDGRIVIDGVQTSVSRTTYDLADGAARVDRTEIRGRAGVIVEPPDGIDAPPARGTIRYSVTVRTERVPSTD